METYQCTIADLSYYQNEKVISVEVEDNYDSYVMRTTVDGIELVTADCQSVKLDAFTIEVNNASSVNESITGKAIAKVEYFNVAGQRMEEPSTGVTLIVTTYTDGTRTTSKVFN
jgi:hypothetical protein